MALQRLHFRHRRDHDRLIIETRDVLPQVGRGLRAAVIDEWVVPDAQSLIELAAEELAAKPSIANVWWSSAGFRRIRWSGNEDWFVGHERDGADVLATIQRAAAEWGAQHWVTARYGASFDPISEEALVAVEPAALKPGAAVEGSRYAMSGDNSGWIIVTEGFPGSVDELSIQHAAHLAADRPDLVRYLALPVGWRFFSSKRGEHVSALQS